ncbi:hypothetical protein N7G274_000339 [Stereocaulon virgatum]|uniref:Uncharacterized protein n=1 Tax=Stereocaulon virgatum TaxID=373712 RepID=A0ABR4AY73_9LECA
MMIGSPVAAGKRPDFKQAQSGGMGWPRLIPIKDQQPQKPALSETSQLGHSSGTPSVQDPNEHTISPTTIEKPTPDDRPLSPIHGTAGSTHSIEDFGTSLIERPDPLGEGPSAPTIPASYAPESSKMASEQWPVESSIESPQAQEDSVSPSPMESAIPAGDRSYQLEEPTASAEPTIPVLTDPVPYYANPKIMVQRPSDSAFSDVSDPRTIDEVLANERRASSRESIPTAGDLAKVPPMPFPDRQLPETQTPGIKVPGVPGVLESVPALPRNRRVRKRSKALRKTRNIAARKPILKALLGRQLAEPTKQALRLLAKGEPVSIESLVVPVVS